MRVGKNEIFLQTRRVKKIRLQTCQLNDRFIQRLVKPIVVVNTTLQIFIVHHDSLLNIWKFECQPVGIRTRIVTKMSK